MRRARVVLPTPLGPQSSVCSPRGGYNIAALACCTATFSPSLLPTRVSKLVTIAPVCTDAAIAGGLPGSLTRVATISSPRQALALDGVSIKLSGVREEVEDALIENRTGRPGMRSINPS